MKLILLSGLGLLLATSFSVPLQASEETPENWYRDGHELIESRRTRVVAPAAEARNVILFIGDGLSLTTVAAARILDGQLRGEPGEENSLIFERFDHLALAKTYNTNQQTPDSAGTMTAMATGVKSFAGAIAVDQRARRGVCQSSRTTTFETLKRSRIGTIIPQCALSPFRH